MPRSEDELAMDRQGLLEPLPTGRDEWWRNLRRELDALTDVQVASLDEETARLDGTAGDDLRDE